MTSGTICELPKETTSLIASTQIITSVSTAVKELVENSLDAGAKNIQVKLKNYGLDIIEIKDDGSGISCENVQKMFLPGYTSKISRFEDLDKLSSYGFRGEALAALCTLGDVSITTKTNTDSLAMMYTIDAHGIPISSKPSHLNKGTIITVNNLFGRLPVRKQYLSSKKRLAEELKKVEQVVQSLAAIKPELRMILVHNNCTIWQKNSVKDLKQSFMQIIGLKIAIQLEYLYETSDQVVIDLMIPKKNLENIENLLTSNPSSMYIYVNRRPVNYKNISKIVTEHIFHHYGNVNSSNKSAIFLLSINIPPSEIDINLEPNKTKVLLKNEKEVIKVIDNLLSTFYNHQIDQPEEEDEKMNENDNEKEEEAEKEENYETVCKKPKLDENPQLKKKLVQLEEKQFVEVDSGWDLEIFNGDSEILPKSNETSVKSLCSQINEKNSTLSTQVEESRLNDVMSNSGSIGEINKISSGIKYGVCEILNDSPEKRILPAWPKRVFPTSPQIEKKTENQTPEINDVEINLKEWSEGKIETEKGVLQGGAVLLQPPVITEEAIVQNNSDKSEKVEKVKTNLIQNFFESRKPPEIQEKPKLWNKVSETTETEKKIETPKTKQTTLETSCTIKKKEKVKKPKPVRKEIAIEISLEKILNLNKLNQDIHSDEIKLIGHLKPSGNWLYIKNDEVGHVRHLGLQELIISQKMLANHTVPLKELDKPITLNEESLGSELWNALLSLDTTYDPVTCRYVINSDVISKNGFIIELEKDEATKNVTRVLITQTASTIPHYGLSELKDILNLYLKNGEYAGLANWRTTPLNNYISNESIRISQQSPRLIEEREIQDLIDTWQLCLKHIPPKCLHGKDIFVPIYQLEDAPSQIQLSQF